VAWRPKLRYVGNELQISVEAGESDISFPAISAHITSYARVKLWKVISYCRENDIKVYYCDTDSIFTNKPLPDFLVSSTELGKMKLEKVFQYGLQLNGLKNYAELDKAGNIIVSDEDNNYIYLEGEKLPSNSKVIKGRQWK
jgi:hypothetical protein